MQYSFLLIFILFSAFYGCNYNAGHEKASAHNGREYIPGLTLPITYMCDSATNIKYAPAAGYKLFQERETGADQLAGELVFTENKSGNRYFLLFRTGDVMYPFVEIYKDNKLLKTVDLFTDEYCGADEDFSHTETLTIDAHGKARIVSRTDVFERDENFEIIPSTIKSKTDTLVKILTTG